MTPSISIAYEISPPWIWREPEPIRTLHEWFDRFTRSGTVLDVTRHGLCLRALRWVAANRAEYVESVGKAVDPVERDRVYREYRDAVNMTAAQLRRWADDPCSREASLTRAPIERNLRLLTTNRLDWDERDVADAKRTIAFIARMSAGEQGEPISVECPLSRRDVSLMNWAYDPR